MATSESSIRQFQVEVPEAELTELRRHINATRWPEREMATDDSQGVRLAMMQELARYWATDYDWHECEAKLNARRTSSTPSPSRSRLPSASSPTSSTRPRGAGPSARIPTTSSTTTRSTGAATSPPGNSQTYSPPRCGQRSGRCASQTPAGPDGRDIQPQEGIVTNAHWRARPLGCGYAESGPAVLPLVSSPSATGSPPDTRPS